MEISESKSNDSICLKSFDFDLEILESESNDLLIVFKDDTIMIDKIISLINHVVFERGMKMCFLSLEAARAKMGKAFGVKIYVFKAHSPKIIVAKFHR